MTASTLGLYNRALGFLGERKLTSLVEAREPRRALDDVYADVLDECLEAGPWKHARRTVQLTASNSVTPAFGYEYAFDVPADLLEIYLLTAAPNGPPMNDWVNEAGFIRAHFDTLYLTYVSNDASYGVKFSAWSPAFARYVGAALGARICMRITQSADKTQLAEKAEERYRRAALSLDARDGPPGQIPTGTWVLSRRHGGFFNRTRGE